MSLNQYSAEVIQEMSMIELAYEILSEKKQALSFQEIINEIATVKGVKKEDLLQQLSQFYTDLNVDGRFSVAGENTWGIKDWYPIDQVEDEMMKSVKPKRKKAKKVVEDEFDDYDEELEDDLEDFDDDLDEADAEDDLDDDLLDSDDDLEDDEIIEDDFDIDDDLEDDEDEDEL
nr:MULTISPECIES: DNA-directed RNA polymerase subunit delta [Bacillus]